MPRLSLKPSDTHVEFAEKISLLDLDDLITFGCKSGKCGACRIRILEGGENISSLNDKEQRLFNLLDIKDEAVRLACQCVAFGNVVIEEMT